MSLEKQKIIVEIKKVDAAKAEMDYLILEKESEIERLKRNIEIQNKRITELNKVLTTKEG